MQRSAVISELKSTAIESQQNVKAFLQDEVEQGNAEQLHAYYIVNGLAVTATKEVAEKVAAFTEVEKILPNENRQLISTVDTDEKDRKSTRLNSSHVSISYAVFCLKKKKKNK